MSPGATVANLSWLATCVPSFRRFRWALANPLESQWKLLQANLERSNSSAYGRAHGFGDIRSYTDFACRVPVVDYDDLAPWILRIQRGESNVLNAEPVTRLLPTSGSTGARKLIPFTDGLQREFNAAIGPWITDLFTRQPAITLGPAYWSITPPGKCYDHENSRVPVGFDGDSQYLGGVRSRLIDSIMAVPKGVGRAADITQFRTLVLLTLLRRADLRLISVWHPSFLTLLLEAMVRQWDELLTSLASGRWAAADSLPDEVHHSLGIAPLPGLVSRLRRLDPSRPHTVWPALRVVSCWADGHAIAAAAELKLRFPEVYLQPKGLLATEAFMTVPYSGAHPIAVNSHFFEFERHDGEICPVESLQTGETYEVIVTTAGGLWRYRMHDRVEVNGFVDRTPSLRFLGRSGSVSDRFGEKLSEEFVSSLIRKYVPTFSFAMLAPEQESQSWHYTLYVQGDVSSDLAAAVDLALRENPNYTLCRELGQLGRVRIFHIEAGGYEQFVRAEVARGLRLGDIKATALSTRTDWSTHFTEVGGEIR